MISILCKYKDTKTWISSDLRNLILTSNISHFLFLLKMKCLLFVNVCNFVDFFKMYYTYVCNNICWSPNSIGDRYKLKKDSF